MLHQENPERNNQIASDTLLELLEASAINRTRTTTTTATTTLQQQALILGIPDEDAPIQAVRIFIIKEYC